MITIKQLATTLFTTCLRLSQRLSLYIFRARLLTFTGLCAMAASYTLPAHALGPESYLMPQYLASGQLYQRAINNSNSGPLQHIPSITAFKQLDGLDPHLMQDGLNAYRFALHHGQVHKPLLTIVDYNIPSDQPRLWIFDLKSHRLLAHLRVAHGANSGRQSAFRFSNKINSHMSSIGTFVTGTTYSGHYGYSLHIIGLNPGINDNAYIRHVVIHAGDYVGDAAVRLHGEAGKTWGCLAMDPIYVKQVINLLKSGAVIWSFG